VCVVLDSHQTREYICRPVHVGVLTWHLPVFQSGFELSDRRVVGLEPFFAKPVPREAVESALRALIPYALVERGVVR
jgi:hypothetical protein